MKSYLAIVAALIASASAVTLQRGDAFPTVILPNATPIDPLEYNAKNPSDPLPSFWMVMCWPLNYILIIIICESSNLHYRLSKAFINHRFWNIHNKYLLLWDNGAIDIFWYTSMILQNLWKGGRNANYNKLKLFYIYYLSHKQFLN